jgi:hypothetical protein
LYIIAVEVAIKETIKATIGLCKGVDIPLRSSNSDMFRSSSFGRSSSDIAEIAPVCLIKFRVGRVGIEAHLNPLGSVSTVTMPCSLNAKLNS